MILKKRRATYESLRNTCEVFSPSLKFAPLCQGSVFYQALAKFQWWSSSSTTYADTLTTSSSNLEFLCMLLGTKPALRYAHPAYMALIECFLNRLGNFCLELFWSAGWSCIRISGYLFAENSIKICQQWHSEVCWSFESHFANKSSFVSWVWQHLELRKTVPD